MQTGRRVWGGEGLRVKAVVHRGGGASDVLWVRVVACKPLERIIVSGDECIPFAFFDFDPSTPPFLGTTF